MEFAITEKRQRHVLIATDPAAAMHNAMAPLEKTARAARRIAGNRAAEMHTVKMEKHVNHALLTALNQYAAMHNAIPLKIPIPVRTIVKMCALTFINLFAALTGLLIPMTVLPNRRAQPSSAEASAHALAKESNVQRASPARMAPWYPVGQMKDFATANALFLKDVQK